MDANEVETMTFGEIKHYDWKDFYASIGSRMYTNFDGCNIYVASLSYPIPIQNIQYKALNTSIRENRLFNIEGHFDVINGAYTDPLNGHGMYDINIDAVNEYGNWARFTIVGIHSTFLAHANTIHFMAQHLVPWRPIT